MLQQRHVYYINFANLTRANVLCNKPIKILNNEMPSVLQARESRHKDVTICFGFPAEAIYNMIFAVVGLLSRLF